MAILDQGKKPNQEMNTMPGSEDSPNSELNSEKLPQEGETGDGSDSGDKASDSSGLTVTAEMMLKEVTSGEASSHLSDAGKKAVPRIVKAGVKFMFDKENNKMIFGSINPNDDIPLSQEAGSGMVQLMKMMFGKSKGTMPQDAIIPAGSVLLAQAFEFINETGLDKATDEDFSEAYKIFITGLMSDIDPSIREKMGAEPSPDQQTDQSQMEQNVQPGQDVQAGQDAQQGQPMPAQGAPSGSLMNGGM